MKHSKVSAETRDKSIREADLGVGAWALKTVRSVTKFRSRKSGKVPSGELGYRFAQMAVGACIFLVIKAIFGIPMNFISGAVLACVMLGSQFGAVRFAVFSLVFWGIVSIGFGTFFGVWPLSPSWWRIAAQGWANGDPVPKTVIGLGILATVVWIAAGRLAVRGVGKAVNGAVENWTFERSQEAQKERETIVEAEYERAGVSRSEIDDLARRNESDLRRAVVFGGVAGRRRGSVSLAKDEGEEESPLDPSEASRRIADLAGKVEGQDADILAGLAAGPDLGGMFATTPSQPAAPSGATRPGGFAAIDFDDDDIPGPSANGMTAASDDDIPGPSKAPVPVETGAIMEIARKVEAPAAVVSAPRINPEASRGRRRMSREDLAKLVDMFNVMSREDTLNLYISATRSKLIRLTDEDYEELRTLDGGHFLITLSQDLKLGDQAKGRTAVGSAEKQKQADEFMTGASGREDIDVAEKPVATDQPSGSSLVDALAKMGASAAGRVRLGAAPVVAPPVPDEAEVEDFENPPADDTAVTPPVVEVAAPDSEQTTEDAVAVEGDLPHEINAVTPRGDIVSFDVDISDSEGTDPEMRRYPTPYASERVSVLNHVSLSDDQKIDRLRDLDRSQGISTVEMFDGDDIAALLNLTPKVARALREKVTMLLGEKPSDMNALQNLYDQRVDLGQKELFERPFEYQRILDVFISLGVDAKHMAERIDSAQARELLDRSIRLDIWFEQNLAGVRSGRLTAPLPLPAPGPNVLDRFASTVDAALRGSGFTPSRPRDAEVAPGQRPETPSVAVSGPPTSAPVEPVVEARRPRKGVDGDWVPDAVPGSDEYMTEMADHFAMIVRRNEDQKIEQERREAAEIARIEREEAERVRLEREELEVRHLRDAEDDRRRRENEFFARLPEIKGGRFIRSLPARFMTDDIMSAVAAIVDGHAMSARLQQQYLAQRVEFLDAWQQRHGEQPDEIDDLRAPGGKVQAEIFVRNGDLAKGILSDAAIVCGLDPESPAEAMTASLSGESENEFVGSVEAVRSRGEEVRGLLHAVEGREREEIARVEREEAMRQAGERIAQSEESGKRVDELEANLENSAREAAELRRRIEDDEARVRAAEEAAAEKTAAADEALRVAEQMRERIRILEEQAAQASAATEVVAAPEPVVDEKKERFEAVIAQYFQPLDVRADMRAFTFTKGKQLFILVDLPDAVVEKGKMAIGDEDMSISEAIKRAVLRSANNIDPALNIVGVIVVANGLAEGDVTDANLGLDTNTLDICARDADDLMTQLGAIGVAS